MVDQADSLTGRQTPRRGQESASNIFRPCDPSSSRVAKLLVRFPTSFRCPAIPSMPAILSDRVLIFPRYIISKSVSLRSSINIFFQHLSTDTVLSKSVWSTLQHLCFYHLFSIAPKFPRVPLTATEHDHSHPSSWL